MPAEGEEVVLGTDPGDLQHLAEQAAQRLRGRGPRHRVRTRRIRQFARGLGVEGGAVQLAAGRDRQVLDALEARRHHVRGQPLGELRHDLRPGQGGAGGEDEPGLQALARAIRCCLQGHGRVHHLEAVPQRLLDLVRLDAEAAQLELSIEPAQEFELRVGAPPGEVAGAVPALTIGRGHELLRRQGRLVQVAPRQRCPAQPQLARFPDRGIAPIRLHHPRTPPAHRFPDGNAPLPGGRVCHPGGCRGDGGLGRAIGVDEAGAVQRQRVPARHPRRRHVLSPDDQRLEHQPSDLASVTLPQRDQLTPEHGWQVEDVQAKVAPALHQHLGRIAFLVGHVQGRAIAQRQQHLLDHRVHPGRGKHQAAVAGGDAHDRCHARQMVGQRALFHHHALGLAGGAGGVDDVRQVGRTGRSAGGPGHRRHRHQGFQRLQAQQRQAAVLHPLRRAGRVRGIGHEPGAAGILQQERQPLVRVGRIQQQHGRARLHHAQRGRRQVPGPLHQHRDHLLAALQRPDPVLHEALRQTVHRLPQRLVAQARGPQHGRRLRLATPPDLETRHHAERRLGHHHPGRPGQRGQALTRIGAGRSQQHIDLPQPAFDDGGVPERRAVLHPQHHPLRLLDGRQRQLELADRQLDLLDPAAGLARPGVDVLPVVHREHDLEQRIAPHRPGQWQPLGQDIERRLGVLESPQHGLSCLVEQRQERRLRHHGVAQRQRVDEEPDLVGERGMVPPGVQGADHGVPLARSRPQPQPPGGHQHHETRQPLGRAQALHRGHGLRRQRVRATVPRVARVGGHVPGLARPAGRQLQHRRRLGQLARPVGQRRGVLGHPGAVPGRVVAVLDLQHRQVRRPVPRAVPLLLLLQQREEIPCPDRDRPVVADHMVQADHQRLLGLQPQQGTAPQRCARQVERGPHHLLRHGVQPGLRLGRRQAAQVMHGQVRHQPVHHPHPGRGLADRIRRRVTHRVTHHERAAQRLVPLGQPPERGHQHLGRQRAGTPQHEAHVVRLLPGIELLQQPQATLGMRRGRPRRRRPARDHGHLARGVEQPGQGGDRGRPEESPDRHVLAELAGHAVHQRHRLEAVPPEHEEVIRHTGQRRQPQQLGPQTRQTGFQRIAGRDLHLGGLPDGRLGAQGRPIRPPRPVQRQGGQLDIGHRTGVSGQQSPHMPVEPRRHDSPNRVWDHERGEAVLLLQRGDLPHRGMGLQRLLHLGQVHPAVR